MYIEHLALGGVHARGGQHLRHRGTEFTNGHLDPNQIPRAVQRKDVVRFDIDNLRLARFIVPVL